MSTTTDLPDPIRGPRQRPKLIRTWAFAVAGMLLLAGWALDAGPVSAILAVSGLSLLLMMLVLTWLVPRLTGPASSDAILDLAWDDPVPQFLAASEGEVLGLNPAAEARLGPPAGRTVKALLKQAVFSSAAMVQRLQDHALRHGPVAEDGIGPQGQLRLSVRDMGRGRILWRMEDFGGAAIGEETAQVPLIAVGRGDSILFMNTSARKLIGSRPVRLTDLLANPPPEAAPDAGSESGSDSGYGSDTGYVSDSGYGAGAAPGALPEGPQRIHTAQGIQTRLFTEIANMHGRRAILLLPPPGALPSAVPPHAGADAQPTGIWDTLDQLPVALLRMNLRGELELANRHAQLLLSVAREPGVSLASLTEGLGRSVSDWVEEAATGTPPQPEFLRLSKSENEAFVQMTLRRVEFGEKPGLIAVLSDATELKTLEAQFVQSQKMQAIGQLAGGVAHDFNNLLTAITGHCDLMLLRHDEGDPDFADLVQINQNANRAAALVGQLLAFSRKQTLRLETLDLRDTLSDLTHLLNRLVGEKVTLSLSHDPLLSQVRADKRQFEQVLMNLVVNARDAMSGSGEIRISTENMFLDSALRRDRATVAAGEYVCVTVSDTGTGIPPDKLPKVFEPFFTTKRVGEGTGLGLSTAYGIIKQTGGFIFADSVMGQGATFTMLLPAQMQPRGTALQRPGVPPGAAVPGVIDGVVLLVEDEAPVRAFASRALRMRGFTVLEAGSGEAALELLKDAATKIDVFVTDVIMPGMDGPTWVKEALTHRPGTQVVFVSGYAQESFDDTSASIPNSVFLPKPFSLAQLTETVQARLSAG
ncbi:ATP-binding protein [Pseudooceanicola aestuarii]|uniref:hybrid sensor histidine kinase/response regulator n=1 Tax=Pseudooceanicola aestuarii TaxID=2697319 RepID=UPI001EF99D26|nr:ATP-binding protein [Pseudooceanicola aestuarii]